VKVVFLDFDGVLNSVRYHRARYESGSDMHEGRGARPCLDREAVKVLNSITESTNAVVVVTSTWRTGTPRVKLSEWLRDAGFEGIVLGATMRFPGQPRGAEIQDWLDQAAQHPSHRLGPVTHFVILDDDTDMLDLYPKLVHIDDEAGLTAEYLPAILKHLEG
jgi:Swiss Army Knife RNA repair-like protein